jgi:hypothetical protein
MPESPDFEQLIRELLAEAATRDVMAMKEPDAIDRSGHEHVARLLRAAAEQLRLVWNARGAADIAKLDTELSILMGATMAGPYVKNLDRALRRLDR